jgi:DNA-binding IclR family transcriptional regulator
LPNSDTGGYFALVPGSIQSIERAAAVLQLLARGRGRLGVGEIAASLSLPKGTTHGILSTLRAVGFVDQDAATGQYRLGDRLKQLGTRHLDTNELRAAAMNWADTLAARCGEAVRIGALTEGNVLTVVHHVFRPDNTAQTLEVGRELPLHATALGKVVLAYDVDLAESVQHGELPSYTRRTIVAADMLARTLRLVRTRGWAAEVSESMPELAAVAAPIRSHGGLVVGAIDVCGPPERICDARLRPHPKLVALVGDVASAISRQLGASR